MSGLDETSIAALEARARAAVNLAELTFSIANDSYALLPFRQALVFAENGELLAVSGLARPAEDSPYLVWLRRAWPWLQEQFSAAPGWFAPDPAATEMPEQVREGWSEWWPTGVLALPLRRRSGEPLGWACFLLDAPPTEDQVPALTRLVAGWSYCWEMLAGHPHRGIRGRWRRLPVFLRRLLPFALCLLLLVPVRQTVLAPAEVVALDAVVIASPLDGVVKTIHVQPNQAVRAGQNLFSLDDTTLRNRLQVAGKGVDVADAELLAMTHKAFDNPQSKAELSQLGGRAQERRAELAAVQAQLERIDVTAPHDGVAVFGDPNDWLGRPVTTGERIMLLADPASAGVLIYLPVADAIALEPGAPVKLFLTVMPLTPFSATISETSYQATLSPEGVASYRLRAAFVPGAGNGEQLRIGLHGTAKIYGPRVMLGYYLLRRPLAKVREWSGL